MTATTELGPGHPLEPLVEALRARADRDAAEALAQADAQAAATLADAQARAHQVLAQARAAGERDAEALLAAERAHAERGARALLLAAEQEAYESARRAARAAVRALREDPVYPALLAALRERALRELGPDATIDELPGGGIAARAGGRRVVYGLDGLADDLLERLGGDLTQLWAP